MNFYLEKVNYENNMWKCCIFVTLGLFILHLLYNSITKNDTKYTNLSKDKSLVQKKHK